MSAGRKQFAVYRLKQDLGWMEVLRKRSWSFIQKYRIQITSDYYEQICNSPFSWDFEPAELRRQLENGLPAAASGEKLQVSDVLVITMDGITTAYYVDPEKLIVLAGFFHTTASTSLLSIDTMDYQIEGRPGNWLAAVIPFIIVQYRKRQEIDYSLIHPIKFYSEKIKQCAIRLLRRLNYLSMLKDMKP